MPDDLPPLPDRPKDASGNFPEASKGDAPKPFVPPQGGPAFPLYPSHSCEGMTLRDYFAAAALTGYLAAHAGDGTRLPEDEKAVRNAFDLADAMLARRVK